MKIKKIEIEINREFLKSVNLSRDFYLNFPIKNYVLTPLVIETLKEIFNSIETPKSNRAWNIVGPYGSGKSAFMLYLSNLLCKVNKYSNQEAKDLIKKKVPDLYSEYLRIEKIYSNGFLPILITGSRLSLEKALQLGIKESLENLNHLDLIKEYEHILNKRDVTSEEIKEVVISIHRKLKENGYDGLLLVIDEFGKILEYVALNVEKHDLFLLQDLAEYASRSMDIPFLLFTILHQAFDQYIKFIGKNYQEEWEKIYGRFNERIFKEGLDQVLYLIASCINSNIKAPLIDEIIEMSGKFNPNTIDSRTFKELSRKSIPLHPSTFEILPIFFFKNAQNERSVFAFLSSVEPYSFSKFIEELNENLDFYYIFNFYDYIALNLSNSLVQNQKTLETWLLIEESLDKLENPEDIEIDLLKTIGLLNIIGNYGKIKASKNFLKYALYPKYNFEKIEKALESLKNKNLIVYRNYNDQYVLWSGSDINIEDEITKSKKYIHIENLAIYLEKFYKLSPIIAKKFYHTTGNLKIFIQEFVEELKNINLDEGIDGKVVYLLPKNIDDIKYFEKEIKKIKYPDFIFVIPNDLPLLFDLIKELESHYNVLSKINEVKDKIAKKEIEIRISQLLEILYREVENVFSYKNCNLYNKGKSLKIRNEKELNEFISEICKRKFKYIPIIKNELINRRKLSASAKTAFRNLVRSIIENYNCENLGITGYPPEYAMYVSLIKNKGIHQKVKNYYVFRSPTDKSLGKTWEYIESFIKSSIDNKKSFEEVFFTLKKPPYGLNKSIISIYLLIGLMKYDSEIAIFENGRFIPILTPVLYERIIKNPSNFELQKYEITNFKKEFFEKLAKVILNSNLSSLKTNKQQLLDIVKPIIVFINNLPNYTKQSKNLSEYSLKLRDSILEADDPYKLIFEYIPKALNVKLDENDIKNENLEKFFRNLIESFKELKYHYDDLLKHIEKVLYREFNINKVGKEGKEELIEKLCYVEDLIPEKDDVKIFINRVKDKKLQYKEWLESIAITIHKEKSPKDWDEEDIRLFDLSTIQIAKKIKELEPIAIELSKNNLNFKNEKIPVKISLLIPGFIEEEKVIFLEKTINTKEFDEELYKKIDKLSKEEKLVLIEKLIEKLK